MAKTNKEEWHIKKKFNLLRRMTVWCLTAAMLLTSLPLMTMTVNAAKRDIGSSYNYYLTVKTAHETNAKTNDDIYCIIKTATGERSVLLDKKNHNDFRKGATDTYTLSLNLQPWEIHAVGFEHRSGSDAVKIEYFKFELPDGTTYSKTINTWFNKYKKTYSIMGTTDRQVTGRGNFDETFDKNVYYELDPANPSDITLNWNGKVTDQYFNEYEMINYPGAIDITFSAYGKAYAAGGSKLDMTVLENNGIATLNTTEGYQSAKYVTGITLNGQKLFEHMEKNRIYKLTLTATLDYEYDYDQYKEHSETYTIYRKGFGLGEASAVSTAYTPLTDYNFYTSESKYSTIKIKIPVIAYDNYNANTIASSLASNISKGNVTARVYYDKTTTNSYVTPQSAYSDKDNVYLVCKTPAGYKNTENIGITVCLYDAKATYSGKEYKLDTSDGNYSCLISTHKVDTQGADVAVLNTDGTQIGTSLNTYQKTHSFKLSIDPKERVFVVNKDNTRSEGYISYELLTQDGKTVKSLKNYKTTPTTKAPYSTNAIYTVEPTETLEGEFKLRITTRDIANNLTTVTYPIKLDNIAPRVQYTLKSANQIDGSMRNEYVFKIEDASQTGKLYYCVVPKGESMPEPGKDIPEHTGAVVSQYGRWSFISQTSAATSAVVSVEKGKYFEGTLYWYTVDAAGNDSRTENKGKYYSTSICIDNIDNDCKIVVDDSTPGKESYDISFVTNKNNRVKYQWRGANIVTALTEYKDGMNPGESWQKLDSGKSVQLTGTYTLVCKVITPDGTESTYTQEFLFDNTAPQVSLKDSGGAATAQRSFTIEAKDLTNIEAFTYSLYKADGTPVDVDVALSCGLPIVSTSLMFEPEEAGTYYIEVTATDINGQTTTAKSDVFAIRNTAPQIETVDIYYLNEFGNVSTIQTEYNGIPLIGGVDYLPTWRVTEEIDGIGNYKHLNISYNIYYRFSADGINYGAWKSRAAQINTEPDVHQLYAYLDYEMNPIALNEGENRIWIQAAFAPAGTDPKTIRHEYLSVNDDFLLIRDTTAPTCSISYDSVEMTADAVYATLTYSDAYTSADDIDIYASKVVGMSFVLSDDGYVIDYSTSPDESINRLMFTENNNDDKEDDNYLELVDRVGNTAILPINITCIDKEPPIVMVTSSSAVEAGQRRDQMIDFWVDKADDTRTEFALVRPLRDLTDSDFIEINPSTTPNPDRPGEEYKVVDLNSENIVWGTLPEDAPDNMNGSILD
ncbi:MAG: hypothetical protein IKZ09_07830 [Clostridia bacterium]|nr:hypothetical protein [Clostridia bacterium]